MALHPYPNDRDEIHAALLEELPVLIRCLERFKDPNDEGQTGSFIAQIFGRLGSRAREGVPKLITLLEKIHERQFAGGVYDLFLAGGCLMAIRDIGPDAAQAASVLYKLLEAPDDHIKHSAAEALEHIGASVLRWPELLKVAKNKELDWIARTGALDALARIEDDLEFVPEVLAILLDRGDERWTRSRAAHTLTSLRRYDEDRVFAAIHREMSEDPDLALRTNLAYALSAFGNRAADAAPLLAKDLESDDQLHRQGAAQALRDIGPPALPFVPQILPLLKDTESVEVVLAAVQALASIGAEKERGVRAALRLVKGESRYYGTWAAIALSDLLPESRAVLGDLREVRDTVKDTELGYYSVEFKAHLARTIERLEMAELDSDD
jgi:HEAT repeat protein